MKTRVPPSAAVIIVAAATLSGCGGALYAINVNSASSKVAQAKELGAETLAPYEYYYAKEHLTKAQSEAAEGDYSDAIDLAGKAEDSADKAIKLSKEAHRGRVDESPHQRVPTIRLRSAGRADRMQPGESHPRARRRSRQDRRASRAQRRDSLRSARTRARQIT